MRIEARHILLLQEGRGVALTLGKDRYTLLENFLNSFKAASGLTCRKPRITCRRRSENTGQP
jgi:hypothetical protein